MSFDVDVTLNLGSNRGPFNLYYCTGSTLNCGSIEESGIVRLGPIMVLHRVDVPNDVTIIKVVDTGGICPGPDLYLPIEGIPETYKILQQDFYPIKTENDDDLNQEH